MTTYDRDGEYLWATAESGKRTRYRRVKERVWQRRSSTGGVRASFTEDYVLDARLLDELEAVWTGQSEPERDDPNFEVLAEALERVEAAGLVVKSARITEHETIAVECDERPGKLTVVFGSKP